MKTAASEIITQFGGTISHQHGVGSDHKALAGGRKGQVGPRRPSSLRSRRFDPKGIFNTGNLV